MPLPLRMARLEMVAGVLKCTLTDWPTPSFSVTQQVSFLPSIARLARCGPCWDEATTSRTGGRTGSGPLAAVFGGVEPPMGWPGRFRRGVAEVDGASSAGLGLRNN